MARHIVVADDIYEQLTRLKMPGESFSNLLRRLLDHLYDEDESSISQ